MDPVTIFSLVLVLFAALMVLGVPVFASLGVASVLGIVLQSGLGGLSAVPDVLHRGLASYSLISIPLFILMGEVIARTNIGGKLFTMFLLWMNRVPGSLAVASVGSSAVFGAMSGVSVAGAATIGRFAIPEMLARGYDARLATGTVAAAGALALLIPPSIGFILYGEVAGQSIGRLFIAAVMPALLVAGLMMIYVVLLSVLRPDIAPAHHHARYTWKQRFAALRDIWAVLLIVLLVLGTIYMGVATPTEAAGMGALGAFLVAGVYGQLDLHKILEIFRSTAVTSGMILLVLASALLFGFIMTRLMIPQKLVLMLAQVDQPPWVILTAVVLFLLVVGMFLDIVSVIVISTPILLPVIVAQGFNPIWFGVILIITCEMAVITPPVGLNLYVIKGIAPQVSINSIIAGALPFVGVELIAIVILTMFPQIALWLPGKL
jgi:tripartite ATP-independent transporter DctM subunit